MDALVSSLLGEMASNLRKTFDYAAVNPVVLLLYEFDAIARLRTGACQRGPGQLLPFARTSELLRDQYRLELSPATIYACSDFPHAKLRKALKDTLRGPQIFCNEGR
jgi:hypothetical protein